MLFFATLINTLSYACSVSSFAAFNFPILLLIRGYNRVDKMPVVLFSLTLIKCLFWLSYSVSANLFLVQVINAIGIIFTAVLLSIYCVIYAEKRIVSALIYNIILISSIGEAYYIVNSLIGSFGLNALGFSSIFASLIKDLGLYLYINQAIRKRDDGKLLYYSMLFSCFNCSLWIGYSSIILNATIAASYAVEFLFSFISLVKLGYYLKSNSETNCPLRSSKPNMPFSKSEVIIIQEKEQP